MNIRYRLGKLLDKLLYWKYPYNKKITLLNNSYLFKIHNRFEEFRIVKLGGEREYILKILKTLGKDDVFYDVGSSVGLISVLSSKKLTSGKVVAFEPDLESYKHLKSNLDINKIDNVTAFQLALSDEKGKATLFTQGTRDRSPSIKPVQGFKNYLEVELDTLDSFVKRKGMQKPSVIKIDTEGSEMRVLAGAKKILESEDKPHHIFIEIHPKYLKDFDSSEDEVKNLLVNYNYKIVWIKARAGENLYHFKATND